MSDNKETKNNNDDGFIIFMVGMVFILCALIFSYSKSESINEEKISNYESDLKTVTKEIEISKINTVFNGEEYHYINSNSEIKTQYVHFTDKNIKIDDSLGNEIIVKLKGYSYIKGSETREILDEKETFFGYDFYGIPNITTYMSEETYKKSGL